MAPPKRKTKSTPSPAPLPGLALGLFAAVAAAFAASRLLRKRPSPRPIPAPCYSSHDLQIHEIATPDCVPRLIQPRGCADPEDAAHGCGIALNCGSEKEGCQEEEEEVDRASDVVDTTGNPIELQQADEFVSIPELKHVPSVGGVPQEIGHDFTERNTESLQANDMLKIPLDKSGEGADGEGEKIAEEFVETKVEMENSGQLNETCISDLQSEERSEGSLAEQPPVLINGTALDSVESNAEEYQEEVSNVSSQSDGGSLDSEGSLQEATSVPVKPFDPEGEIDDVAINYETKSLDNFSFTNCSAEPTPSQNLDGIGWNLPDVLGDVSLTPANCSDAHGCIQPMSSVETQMNVELDLQSVESVKDIVTTSGVLDVCVSSEANLETVEVFCCENASEDDSSQISVVLNATQADQEDNVSNTEQGESMAALDIFSKIEGGIEIEGRIETDRQIEESRETLQTSMDQETIKDGEIEESKELLPSTMHEESINQEDGHGTSLEKHADSDEHTEQDFITSEGNLQAEEGLQICCKSADNDVEIGTKNCEEQCKKEEETKQEMIESFNMKTEPEITSTNSSSEREMHLAMDSKNNVSSSPETEMKKCMPDVQEEQARSIISDKLSEPKNFISEQMSVSTTPRHILLPNGSLSSASQILEKGKMTLAAHLPREMALICVLIGILSTMFWYLLQNRVAP